MQSQTDLQMLFYIGSKLGGPKSSASNSNRSLDKKSGWLQKEAKECQGVHLNITPLFAKGYISEG